MAVFSATEAIVAWLRAMGYEASSLVPSDAPDAPAEFVTVERQGGGVADMVDHPSMTLQAWAPTDERAEALANGLRSVVLLEAPPRGIARVSVESGPYRFYDEMTRCPRYQLTLDVTSQISI